MGNFKILEGEQALAHSVMGRLIAVYGVPGAGKTSFCLSATKTQRVLFIDTEHAAGKVFGSVPAENKDSKNFATVNVKTVSEAIELLNDPGVDLSRFDTIVFDSATHLIEEEMRRIRKVKKLSFTDWGDLGNNFKDLLAQLQTRGLNVVITVHEEETADENGNMQHRPKTEGKASAAALVQRADNLLFIDVNENGERVLHTQPSPTYYAKSRDPLQSEYVGNEVTYETVSKDFTHVEEQNATEEQVAELKALIVEAKVKNKRGFYQALYWDGKGDLAVHNYLRGIEIMQNQIAVNKAKEDAQSDADSK